ncbi:MAG: hypothetical protein HRT89_17785, partial [Lentisphaeria bacterium]|nr:hypothetical protein [Lentisphaeria bacterium]
MLPVEDCNRLDKYLKAGYGKRVAIFDIGTRAIRLLVAPKVVATEEWQKSTFCNLGMILNLGDDIDPVTKRIDITSRKLRELLDFLSTLKSILIENGVDETDISAIGTAVFRWTENIDDLLRMIFEHTGIDINVLSAENEAQLTLQAIGFTYPFRHEAEDVKLGEDDIILLLDQGGGSMEVSYMAVNGKTPVKTFTFDGLGTIALRKEFFAYDQAKMDSDGEWVGKQIAYIQQFIAEKINSWDGYPEITGRNLHAYG